MTSSLTTIARGESSGIVESQRVIVRDAGQWRALWAAHAGPATAAPDVDFTSRMVAAVFAGYRALLVPAKVWELRQCAAIAPVLAGDPVRRAEA